MPKAEMGAFIRLAKPSDKADMAHICQATFPPSLQGSEPAFRIGPYIWTHQFPHLSPSTCFVLDDGAGKAVGYCIGCPDVDAFVAAYPAYVREVLDRTAEVPRPEDLTNKAPWMDPSTGGVNGTMLAQLAYNPEWLLRDHDGDDGRREMRQRRKGTMHIDLLEGWRGKGWGRRLIETFMEACRRESPAGSEGVWISVAGDNGKVVAFYERVGWRVWRDNGEKGIDMVYDF